MTEDRMTSEAGDTGTWRERIDVEPIRDGDFVGTGGVTVRPPDHRAEEINRLADLVRRRCAEATGGGLGYADKAGETTA